VLTAEPRSADITALIVGEHRPAALLLEVPVDIQLVTAQTPERAALWHAAVRTHFEWALQHGYVVTGLRRDPVTSRAFYVLELHEPGSST
jgi:predicted GNAT superfamily acetyltransferase